MHGTVLLNLAAKIENRPKHSRLRGPFLLLRGGTMLASIAATRGNLAARAFTGSD